MFRRHARFAAFGFKPSSEAIVAQRFATSLDDIPIQIQSIEMTKQFTTNMYFALECKSRLGPSQ